MVQSKRLSPMVSRVSLDVILDHPFPIVGIGTTCADMRKITIVESASSRIKSYTQLNEFDL